MLSPSKARRLRSFLYPAGKAKLATPEILKAIRLEELREEERKAVKAEAEGMARLLQNAGKFTLRRKSERLQGLHHAIESAVERHGEIEPLALAQ